MTRAEIVKVMARAMCLGKACQRNCPDVDHAPCPDALYSWQEDAERILTALEASGMAVVPREPSDERLNAICHAINSRVWKPGPWIDIARHVYAAALPPRSE